MTASARFRADVEGLRAVAVGLVVAYHAGVPGVPGGYVGVDVFFVLSGFLITSLLLTERESSGRVSLLGFYARRCRRIVPAATLVLLAVLVASHLLLVGKAAADVGADARAAALFMANWHFAAEGMSYLSSSAPPSPLRHFWSLAVEEQFYLVWPAIFAALTYGSRHLQRRQLAVGLGALMLASLGWSVVQTAQNGVAAYFSPFTRSWELLAGALLAVATPLVARVRPSVLAAAGWCGLVLVVLAACLYSAGTAFPGTAAALPVAGAVLVLAAGCGSARRGPELLLRLRPFQGIGRLSYSLYLWHWPLLVLGAAYAGRPLPLATKLWLVAAALVLSAITYALVENPARRWRPLVTSARVSVTAGLAVTVAATAVATVLPLVAGGTPPATAAQPAPPQVSVQQVRAAVSAAGALKVLPTELSPAVADTPADEGPAFADGCLLDVEPVATTSECVYGDVQADRTLVLFGDSHAAQWLPAFIDIGQRERWRVLLIAKVGCPTAAVQVWSVERRRTYQECEPWRSASLERIARLAPELVVHTANTNTSLAVRGRETREGRSEAWQAGLIRTIEELRPVVGRQVLLGDIPTMSADPAQCLPRNTNAPLRCSTPRSEALQPRQRLAERRAAEATGIPYIDVLPFLCTERVCPAVIGSFVVYRDRYHLTATYSRWVAGSIAKELPRP